LGLAQQKKGHVEEIEEITGKAEEDPCRNRKGQAGRRLKSKTRAHEVEEKTEIEKLLAQEKADIESEEDPCKLPEEAVLKVQRIIDEEMEGAEFAAHEKEVKYLKEELNKLRGSSKKPHTKIANGTGNSTAKNGSTAKASSKKKAPNITRGREPPPASNCSDADEDCRQTQCCSDPGRQCYGKNEWWASCRVECVPGVPDPSDLDSEVWTCEEYGNRTAGEVVDQEKCHDVGDNCMTNRCCKDPGFACYTKNETFGMCLLECTPGSQYFDLDNADPWSCRQAGPGTPSTIGDWVEENCSGEVDDCSQTKCCSTVGFMCYAMNEGWAQCKENCSQESPADRPWEEPWTCKELGYRTPPRPISVEQPPGGKVGRWVKDVCSKNDEDCSSTSCCTGRGKQCYQRDDKYAACADECEKNSTWSCKELGTRSWGLAYVGYPSLFCFSLLRVDTYELELVKYQWTKRAGIFACDSFRVFSDTVTTVAGRKTLKTPKVEVGVSKDGTAGNTLLFMKVWDMIFEDGTVWDHDWTIKADPDAVLLSDRLRGRLEPYTNNYDHGGRLFVVNCNAWPGSDFPMMYGSVEIFSQAAMRQYKEHVDKCMEVLPWQEWGEDYFLTRCMDQIDVGRIEDYQLVGDSTCSGPQQSWNGDCNLGLLAAFHPFKEIETWSACFDTAIR